MANQDTANHDAAPYPTCTGHVLYVLFHGLICLVDVGKLGFIAHLIDMGRDHKYLAGEWLIEREFPEKQLTRLQLVGVTPGHGPHGHLDPALNAIVRVSKAPAGNEAPLRAIITLPRPERITHGVQGTLQDTALDGNMSKFSTRPTIVSGLTIFEYKFDKFEDVGLVYEDGTSFVDCPKPAGPPHSKCVSVFHVYDEPPRTMPDQHHLDEFNLSLQLLSAGDISLNNASVASEPNDNLPDGLIRGETSTLDERPKDVSALLALIRRGKFPKAGGAGGGAGGPVCGGVHGTTV